LLIVCFTYTEDIMAKVALSISVLMVVVGLAYLALSDVPAPSQPVSKPIPMERFFK
jgi:hypothetical protein